MSPTAPATEADFAQLVNDYEALLRRSVQKYLFSYPSDHDDALQDALMRIWKRMLAGKFPTEPEKRLQAARMIQKSICVELLRRRRRGGDEDHLDHEVPVDSRILDGFLAGPGEAPTGLAAELRGLLADMHSDIDAYADNPEFERRLVALQAMLPALKDVEQQVLLAHHPAGDDRKSTQVAKQLNLSHGQARAHYSEAMAILRPLLAHTLAPGLSADEAADVLNYSSGVMTDKRARGRMKRHLEHCAECKALYDAERAVIGVGAKLFLPLPAFLGLGKALTASTAVVAGGGAAAAGLELGAGAGAGGVLSSVVSGIAAKVAVTAGAAALATGSYIAVQEDKAPKATRAVAQATATPETAPVSATPTTVPVQPTAAATTPPQQLALQQQARARAQREQQRRERRQRAQRRERREAIDAVTAIPTVTPNTSSSGSSRAATTADPVAEGNPIEIPTAAPPTTGIDPVEPPEDRANSNFSQEFAP